MKVKYNKVFLCIGIFCLLITFGTEIETEKECGICTDVLANPKEIKPNCHCLTLQYCAKCIFFQWFNGMNKNCGFCRKALDHPLIHGAKLKDANLIRSVFSKFFAGKELATSYLTIQKALSLGNRKIRNQIYFLQKILSKGTILERLENNSEDIQDKHFNFVVNFVQPNDLTEKNKNKQTVLHLALTNNAEKLALKFLNNGVKFDEKDIWARTPLHIACSRNLINIVKILIQKNCDIDAKNYQGLTSLDISLQKKHVEIAKLLIQNGANFETSRAGDHPVLLASKIGDIELLKLLWHKHANLLVTHPNFGTNAFHYAARFGHLNILIFLYNQNENFLNQVDNEGWSAIHYSAHAGNFKITQFLIYLGAEKDIPDIYGQTPALLASLYDYWNIVDLFGLSLHEKQILLKQNWHKKSNWPKYV